MRTDKTTLTLYNGTLRGSYRGLQVLYSVGTSKTSLDALDELKFSRSFESSPFKQREDGERCLVIVPGNPFVQTTVFRDQDGKVSLYGDGFSHPVLEALQESIEKLLTLQRLPFTKGMIRTLEYDFAKQARKYDGMIALTHGHGTERLMPQIYSLVQLAHFLTTHKGMDPRDALLEACERNK